MILVKMVVFDEIFGGIKIICGPINSWETDKLKKQISKMKRKVHGDKFRYPQQVVILKNGPYFSY